jgi:hypothetical protein
MWKNKDFDKMVKIIGLMGEKDGQRYYQTDEGSGIPESELFPERKQAYRDNKKPEVHHQLEAGRGIAPGLWLQTK